MSEYKVKFEVFEGPLDLLLYLIKKEEVDIYEVNLTGLATQFIEYIDTMRLLDLDIAGEFLVMAATLMYIKSRELLPVDQQIQVEGEDEGEDPRWELIRQLVEYKKFKDAAARLQVLEVQQENVFPRLPGKLEFESDLPLPKPDVSIFDLLNAVNLVLQRFTRQREDLRDIYEDKWTVSEKIEHVLRMVTERVTLKFSELFEAATSRSEVVCTFLALLELMRLKQLACSQPEPFGEIEVTRGAAAPARSPELEPAGVASNPRPRIPNPQSPILLVMDLKYILESLLFSAQKPLSVKELREVLTHAAEQDGADAAVRALKKTKDSDLMVALEQLAKEHEEARRSYRLVCVAGAWQFVTQPEFGPWLKSLVGVKARPTRLSQPALETLAIIAYRQPITRAEVEQIRGVNVDGTMQTLTERGLVETVGRAEIVGRPPTYGTTGLFLEYFGLPGLDGLPAADELRRIVIEKPAGPLTADPGLATTPPEQLSLEEASGQKAEVGDQNLEPAPK